MPAKLHTIYSHAAFKMIGDNLALLFFFFKENILCSTLYIVFAFHKYADKALFIFSAQFETISKLSIFNCLSTERHVGLQLSLHR